MPWYKSGTVSVTQNSNAVIGTGTAFIANSRVGDAFRGPDGGWYELTNIASDTAVSISPNYQGTTNGAGGYALAPLQGYVKDSADALRSLVNLYGAKMAALGTTGNYDVLPVTKGGTGATSDTAARAALSAAKSGANSDITALTGLTTALTVTQGGVAESFIDGLIPTWNSGSSITIGTGSAYIPSLGKSIKVVAPIVVSGMAGLTTDAFIFFYLYNNNGTPAVEYSTTWPAQPYSGLARTKNLDTSRRMIFCARTDSSGNIYNFKYSFENVFYVANVSAVPFRCLSGGLSTSFVTVSLAAVVPPHTQSVILRGSCAVGTVGLLTIPAVGGLAMVAIDGGARNQINFVTDTNQAVAYSLSAASGSGMYIDVAGYGMER
ncbi:hypothetical protein PMI36_05554 [Pseudomonas sp. GM79]|uniref:hypothetical protein n=1 Tax=Pseudomonas sp. GM79 TaxID=1144338 RepID=UPI00026F7CA5|nr:hypothetical protein [Pseudomonas sp. GM79]EJN17220.1 hypothetical protein PMI36_05554 [Pseudomonas sp. GM79]